MSKAICICFIFISYNLIAQTGYLNWQTFENKQIGIGFKYPPSWEKGSPEISNIYWVAIPNFKSSGNVVLKVNPWATKPDLNAYTPEQYKREILSTSIYYKDIVFIDFNKDPKIAGVNGIYAYYKGVGVLKDKFYYEIIIQWWSNNLLYTLQGQFSEPELTNDQVNQFKQIIKTIKKLN